MTPEDTLIFVGLTVIFTALIIGGGLILLAKIEEKKASQERK